MHARATFRFVLNVFLLLQRVFLSWGAVGKCCYMFVCLMWLRAFRPELSGSTLLLGKFLLAFPWVLTCWGKTPQRPCWANAVGLRRILSCQGAGKMPFYFMVILKLSENTIGSEILTAFRCASALYFGQATYAGVETCLADAMFWHTIVVTPLHDSTNTWHAYTLHAARAICASLLV
jgi:hypothetical protein